MTNLPAKSTSRGIQKAHIRNVPTSQGIKPIIVNPTVKKDIMIRPAGREILRKEKPQQQPLIQSAQALTSPVKLPPKERADTPVGKWYYFGGNNPATSSGTWVRRLSDGSFKVIEANNLETHFGAAEFYSHVQAGGKRYQFVESTISKEQLKKYAGEDYAKYNNADEFKKVMKGKDEILAAALAAVHKFDAGFEMSTFFDTFEEGLRYHGIPLAALPRAKHSILANRSESAAQYAARSWQEAYTGYRDEE